MSRVRPTTAAPTTRCQAERALRQTVLAAAARGTIEMLERRVLLSAALASDVDDHHFVADHAADSDAQHVDGERVTGRARKRTARSPRPTRSGDAALAPAAGGRVIALDSPETEPNNTAGTATPITLTPTNNVISGAIDAAGDFDFYSFTLSQRSGVFLEVDGEDAGGTLIDSQVVLYNSTGTTVVGQNDDGDDFESFALLDDNETIRSWDAALYVDLAPGTYVARVSSSQLLDPSGTGTYAFKARASTDYGSSVPVFQSLPGATDTLYLDFDGHSATTGAWGEYEIDAYDFSGNGAEFSPGERAAIENVWRVVAEDYAPFRINVTTSYAGSFADGVGFRQVIGNSNGSELNASSTTLGQAYPRSYSGFGASDNVAFTFAKNFGRAVGLEDGNSGHIGAAAVEIGNTSSHEFGHALGLSHYGGTNAQRNGIMHTQDFGANRERWKAGNTHSGESPIVAQVDVNTISSTSTAGGLPNNTFGYRTDDHLDNTGGATVLVGSAGRYTGSGIIGTKSDLDFFRFEALGGTTLRVRMLEHVANLDAELRVYNATGALVTAASDPSDSIFANLTLTLPAGTYYAEVRSDGAEGEIGQYTLDIVTTPPGGATGAISGKTFHDFDADFTYDPGETLLSGVTVNLDRDNDGSIDATAVSNASGDYSFTGLVNATYQLTEVPPSGFAVTTTRQVIISFGEAYANQHFANRPIGAVVFTGTAGADAYELRRGTNAANPTYEVRIGGALVHVVPTAGVTSLAFNLGGANDALTVNHVNGAPMPTGGIRYDGGGLPGVDFDTLTVDGAAASETFDLVNATSGDFTGNIALHNGVGQTVDAVTVNGGAGADTLNIDQVVFALVTFNGGTESDVLFFNASNGSDDDLFVDDGAVGGGGNFATFTGVESMLVSALFGDDAVVLNTGAGAPATTIDLGDGNDTISLEAAATNVTVLGGNGNDEIQIAAGATAAVNVAGGAGSDTVEIAGTAVADAYTLTAAALQRPAAGSIAYNTTETMLVELLGGADTLTVSGTSTALTALTVDGGGDADTFNITPSSTALVRVLGADPTTAPGDTLNVTPGGATQTGSVGPSSEAGFQQISYANRQPVRFTQIETLGTGIEHPPAIGGMTDSPDPVAPGAPLTLTATGVTDANGGTLTAAFYRETNGVAGLQVGADAEVGSIATSPYTVTVAAPVTPGAYTYYAQVTDATGRASDVVQTTSTVAVVDVTSPTVTGVFVGSSAWTSFFNNFLQSSGQGEAAFGFRIDAASHATPLPWTNVNRLSVRFSEPVTIADGAMTLRGVRFKDYGALPMTYDAATFTATWSLPANLLPEKLLTDLRATGVTDASGNALDGEWANPAPASPPAAGVDAFPSGDGTPGGDFRFQLNVLPGDANRSGGTTGLDVLFVRASQSGSVGTPIYSVFKDLDGNGAVQGFDILAANARQGFSLPVGEPAVPVAETSTITTATATSSASLFASGPTVDSALQRLGQQYDLLGNPIETPLV